MKSAFRNLCCTSGALLLGSLAVRADDQTTRAPPWPDTYVTRVEALALLQSLDADLLSHDSATLTLERWCGAHRLATVARIVAERVAEVDKPPSPEQRGELGISSTEPVRYRRVKLLCGTLVLSEADNWYVPSRLTPDMNKTLDTTNTPFGKAVQALHFRRHTLSSRLLWRPLPDGWELSPARATADGGTLSIPPAVLENKAVLSLPDGTPFSEVVETYSNNVLAFAPPATGEVAQTPPLGWNSWDAYGLTINESDFKANVRVLAGMKGYGWQYAVIDEGWYLGNPFGETLETRKYLLDAYGLLAPVVSRFPSAAHAAGLKPLADWVHAQGLKFGIHIVRGIPKQAVRDNLPIAGSAHRAADAADTSDTCPWDDGNYGVSDTPAGQAYYDSMFREYARWELDFIKVDCIADHPYKASEIRQIATAIERAHRPMVLSLSPGPANVSHAAQLGEYAHMWRISNDVWDGWKFTHEKPDDDFPNGLSTAFDNLARWSPYARPGNWPDADMLPVGALKPHPGWGNARMSRLTQDEQRTQWTLWAIARSPLIVGANLEQLDEFTRSMMTDRDILEANQKTDTSRPMTNLPVGFEQARVWIAHEPLPDRGSRWFIALFNLSDAPAKLHASWSQLNIETPAPGGVDVTLPAHGSAIYHVEGPSS